jgi:hypothetical protein
LARWSNANAHLAAFRGEVNPVGTAAHQPTVARDRKALNKKAQITAQPRLTRDARLKQSAFCNDWWGWGSLALAYRSLPLADASSNAERQSQRRHNDNDLFHGNSHNVGTSRVVNVGVATR